MINKQPSKNKVVILGLDTFRQKNIAQIELMNRCGYFFDIFTNDLLGDSEQQFACLSKSNRLFKLEANFFSRINQLIHYFHKNKAQMHHAEIYSGGRFSCFYGIISQCFKIRYIVCERGDLKSIIGGYSLKIVHRNKPHDNLIKPKRLYLYNINNKIEYAVKNDQGHIERTQLDDTLPEIKNELLSIFNRQAKKLTSEQEKILFKLTSEKDHTLNELPFIYRLTYQYVYRFANIVWYKEPYMEGLLKAMHIKHYKMIPNAVDVPTIHQDTPKDIDFLWVNRIVHRRNFEWVVHYFHDKVALKTAVLGCIDDHVKNLPHDVQVLLSSLKGKEHFEMQGYIQPVPYYERAKFFVLPATYVFGNYSLLEAMSYGVVPIVSETESTKLLVQDKVNGIVFKHDFESFTMAIEYAMNMDEKAYQLMSDNARQSIIENFSVDQWANKLKTLYAELDSI